MHVPLSAAARRRIRPLLLATALVAATLGVSAAAYLRAGFTPWWHALGAAAGEVTNMALVVGIAWRLAARDPDPGTRGARGPALLARHTTGAAVAATLAMALGIASAHLAHPHAHALAGAPAPGVTLGGNAIYAFFWYVFLYGTAAAATHASRVHARLREREAAAARAELLAIRGQLNPHFLFNALHSVGVLVRADPAAAEDAIERLGDLLRYVLAAHRAEVPERAEGDDVPLAVELDFVRDYLALERLRFGERLRVHEAIDPAALACRVPRLLLQPLVENAVKHAVGPRPSGATVYVTARRVHAPRANDAHANDAHANDAHDTLVLEVADDGPGTAPSAAAEPAGVGLAAVRRQLAARYATLGRVEVAAGPAGGFRVRLTVPAVPAMVRPVAESAMVPPGVPVVPRAGARLTGAGGPRG